MTKKEKRMDFWKVGFLCLLWASSVLSIGAVELGRHQPTERISGGVLQSLFSPPFLLVSSDSF